MVGKEELAGLLATLDKDQPLSTPCAADYRLRLETLGRRLPAVRGVAAYAMRAGDLDLELVVAPGVDTDRWVVYMHGGGYVAGGLECLRMLAAFLARASNALVLSVGYRLAPEHPFPAAQEDCLAAYRWVLAGGADPARVTLAGESAGGGLVLATMIAARDAGLPLPGAAVCLSPWVDLEVLDNLERPMHDPIVRPSGLRRAATMYLAGADARQPLASPVYGDLSGFPPLLVQVGKDETLLPDALWLTAAVQAAGGTVELELYDDVCHGWQCAAEVFPAGQEAVDRIGDFIRLNTGGGLDAVPPPLSAPAEKVASRADDCADAGPVVTLTPPRGRRPTSARRYRLDRDRRRRLLDWLAPSP